MAAVADNSVFGFYASFQSGESEQDFVRQFIWGNNGLKELLNNLKWEDFGQDFHLILFEIYVKPTPYLRDA